MRRWVGDGDLFLQRDFSSAATSIWHLNSPRLEDTNFTSGNAILHVLDMNHVSRVDGSLPTIMNGSTGSESAEGT